MTVATINDAVTEMEALFAVAWTPTGFPVAYSDEKPKNTGAKDSYARFLIQHEERAQASLANASGVARRRARGFLQAEIYTPLGGGYAPAYALAELVLNAYEGKATQSDVWFRNVRVIEQSCPHHMQVNVLADFEYDQLN